MGARGHNVSSARVGAPWNPVHLDLGAKRQNDIVVAQKSAGYLGVTTFRQVTSLYLLNATGKMLRKKGHCKTAGSGSKLVSRNTDQIVHGVGQLRQGRSPFTAIPHKSSSLSSVQCRNQRDKAYAPTLNRSTAFVCTSSAICCLDCVPNLGMVVLDNCASSLQSAAGKSCGIIDSVVKINIPQNSQKSQLQKLRNRAVQKSEWLLHAHQLRQ